MNAIRMRSLLALIFRRDVGKGTALRFLFLCGFLEHRFQFFFCNLSRGSFREFFDLAEFPRNLEKREILLQVFF